MSEVLQKLQHQDFEQKIRTAIANPWFRFAERHNFDDEELKLTKQLIDINAYQIIDIITQELTSHE